MNKKELRSLTDYLIFKSDSLQLQLNNTLNANNELLIALSDSILKINNLNKQIETANNTLYLKDGDIIQLNSRLKIINDSLILSVEKFNQLKQETNRLSTENQSLKDSLINAQFKILLLNPDVGATTIEETVVDEAEEATPIRHNKQKYSGTYPYGKATYVYYDDPNGNRVYDGSFYYGVLDQEEYKWIEQFNLNDNQAIDGKPFCEGNYSLNIKTGPWSFGTTTSYGKSDTTYAAYGKFKNNLPNGAFRYILNNRNSSNKNKRVFDFTVNYKDGAPFGKVTFKCSGNDKMRWEGNGQSKVIKSLEITGSLSSTGLPSGEWIIKYQLETFSYQRKDFYLNGTLIKSELKDFATGNVIFSQDFSSNYKLNPQREENDYFNGNFEDHPYFIDNLLLFLNGNNHKNDSYGEYNTNYIFPNSLIWMGKM